MSWKTNHRTRQKFPVVKERFKSVFTTGRLEDVDPRTQISDVIYPEIRAYLERHGFREIAVQIYRPHPDPRVERMMEEWEKKDRIYFEDARKRGVQVPVHFNGKVYLVAVASHSDITQDILDHDPFPSFYFKHEGPFRTSVNTLRKWVEQ